MNYGDEESFTSLMLLQASIANRTPVNWCTRVFHVPDINSKHALVSCVLGKKEKNKRDKQGMISNLPFSANR